jgi:hypothetical protein
LSSTSGVISMKAVSRLAMRFALGPAARMIQQHKVC